MLENTLSMEITLWHLKMVIIIELNGTSLHYKIKKNTAFGRGFNYLLNGTSLNNIWLLLLILNLSVQELLYWMLFEISYEALFML